MGMVAVAALAGSVATDSYDHGYAAADEISSESRQPIDLIIRPAEFDNHVLTLDITGFSQTLRRPPLSGFFGAG
jgi:hypothetical protein